MKGEAHTVVVDGLDSKYEGGDGESGWREDLKWC